MIFRSPRLLVFALASAVQLSAQTSGFKVIQPSGADMAYSAGILANGTLYVSGQGSSAKDLTSQAAEAMHKVQTVLRGAGMDFENVVWMNVYLTDANDQAAMDDVYWKMIGSSPPARTVLTVAALPHGEKVEINCIAVAMPASAKQSGQQAGREDRASTPLPLKPGKCSICRRKGDKIR